MKKLVTVQEVPGEGMTALLGERVILLCMNYFYAGTLTGVNDDCVLLEDAGIVYDTGAWTNGSWADFQKVPHPVYVKKDAIESFMKGK